MTTTLALNVTAVSKAYPTGWRHTSQVLKKISFAVPAGEVVSLIGQNGAGKTTLLKLITGVNRPTKGAITIFGQPASTPTAREKLGFMPENPQFYPTLTAWQYLLFSGGLSGLSSREVRPRAQALLKEVGLRDAARQSISTFSKGMRQRLGFAQASLTAPQLLILDEPLDGLDPLGRRDLKELIKKYRAAGTTVVLSSHILSDIAEMSDKIGVIHRGQLLYFGPTADFMKRESLEESFVEFISRRS